MKRKLEVIFTPFGILSLLCVLIIVPALAQESGDQQDEYLRIGGALRINLVSENYEQAPTTTSTYATLDTWRINVDALHSGIRLDFEYRFYPTFNTHFIHHGFLGYDITKKLNLQLGVTRVPYGNLEYNSHSWWFLIPYYVGLEDDYDMGVKLIWKASPRLDIRGAYFRQSAPAGPSYGQASFGGPAAGTYSYNVIPDNEGVLSATGATSSIREMNQLNLRIAYELTAGTVLGFSGQIKGLYNLVLQETDYGNAWALHLNSNFSDFNLKLQYSAYDYYARDDDGNVLSRIQMGAYGDPYYNDGVAAKAQIITAALSYSIPVNWGPFSNIMPYLDYALMLKHGTYELSGKSYKFSNTIMAVPGFMLTAGKVFTYVDLAIGKNQPWLTNDFGIGLGKGWVYTNEEADYYYLPAKAGQPVPLRDVKWNWRFNINVGYYF